jgi:hypothetical protein
MAVDIFQKPLSALRGQWSSGAFTKNDVITLENESAIPAGFAAINASD